MGGKDEPDEVTESQHEDTYACELHCAGEIGVEVLNICGKHGREREWTETLSEGNKS